MMKKIIFLTLIGSILGLMLIENHKKKDYLPSIKEAIAFAEYEDHITLLHNDKKENMIIFSKDVSFTSREHVFNIMLCHYIEKEGAFRVEEETCGKIGSTSLTDLTYTYNYTLPNKKRFLYGVVRNHPQVTKLKVVALLSSGEKIFSVLKVHEGAFLWQTPDYITNTKTINFYFYDKEGNLVKNI